MSKLNVKCIMCHINFLRYHNLTIIKGKQQNICMLLLSVTRRFLC